MDRQVVFVYLVELLRDISIFIVGSFVVLYLRSIALSVITIGMLFSLKGAFDVIFSLPIGYSSDRWGRKPWILISPVLAVITYWLFIICRSIPQFVFVFILWNVSELCWNYSVPMFLNDIVENRGRGDALAKLSLMNTIAGVTAPVFAGSIAEVYGMSALFEVAIVFEAAIIGIVVYWARRGFLDVPSHPELQDQPAEQTEGTSLVNNIVCLLKGNIFYFALAMMVMGFGWAILDIATPLFLKEELGISYLEFGGVMSAISVIGAVAKIFVGKFTDVHGRKSTLLFSTFCAGVCMIIVGFVTSELQFVAVRGAGLLFGAVMWIIWMASFHDSIKKKRATTSVLIDTLSGITWTLGSLSGGFIIYAITAKRCFFLIGGIYILTVFVFSRIKKEDDDI